MLSEVFYWVINLSILGTLCGIVLLLLRKIKIIPRLWIFGLWIIPFLRFFIPFGISSEYSVLSFISKFTTKTVAVAPNLTLTNFVTATESYSPITYKTIALEKIINIASIIWLIVAAILVLTSILLYILTKSEIKNAVKIKNNIYKSDEILYPAVYGIFKPKIVIPQNLIEGDINYILLHEKVHIKRKDNLWRILGIFTACIHWFNPFAWIFLMCFFTDMELACDTEVLKNIPNKKQYATAVLSAAQGRAFFATAFGGAKTRVRIENILSYN